MLHNSAFRQIRIGQLIINDEMNRWMQYHQLQYQIFWMNMVIFHYLQNDLILD